MARRALVLDADLPPALTIARSLRRRGIRVDVASHLARPLGKYSRTVDRHVRYPDPLEHEIDFVEWIGNALQDETYDLIIPVTERTVSPLLKHRAGLRDERLAIAPSEALAVVLDKARTMALAESLDIATPSGHLVRTMADLDAVETGLSYPVVIKPVSSVGTADAKNVQLAVTYGRNRDELRAQVQHALRYGHVLLQTYFAGDGVGIELIADHGKIEYAFQHKRLHEVPLTGGGSSLRMSVPITPVLLDASTRLIEALQWHGVAMVEFKYQPDTGQYCLMEINGRFWGSLPLAVVAGADFPAMLFELLVDGKVGHWPAYRPEVYCRQLARDVAWLEQVIRKEAPPGLVTLPSNAQVIKDTALCLSPRHYFDVQSWRDPLPGLVDLFRVATSYVSRFSGRWAEKRELGKAYKAWQDGDLANRLPTARNLLFLCYGNINRSAVAQAYAQQVLAADITIVSAGFHAQSGRPADPVMTDVAAKRGIDMLGWASKTLTPAMIVEADAIFVMELAHQHRLLEGFPEAAGKTYLLGMATASHSSAGEIDDPYGKEVSAYKTAFERVTRAVDRIAQLMKAPGSTP